MLGDGKGWRYDRGGFQESGWLRCSIGVRNEYNNTTFLIDDHRILCLFRPSRCPPFIVLASAPLQEVSLAPTA